MSVFYRGFYDAFTRHLNGPGKKRKFIELYLYAQGMIYADFISSLKTAIRKSNDPEDPKTPVPLDLEGKMNLMHELGILDFLIDRYLNPENELSDFNLAEAIIRITGELPERKEMILHFMKKMSHKNASPLFIIR